MFEFEWKIPAAWEHERSGDEPWTTRLAPDRVRRTSLLHWEEHCVECSPPVCYGVCPLYVERGDSTCARFVYGIAPNPDFNGLFDRGADLRFRRWGKIEANLSGRRARVRSHAALAALNAGLGALLRLATRVLRSQTARRRASGLVTRSRRALLGAFGGQFRGDAFDDFVLECHSADPESFRLFIELSQDGTTTFRHAFDIEQGHNLHTLPGREFGTVADGSEARLTVYPANDAERRVVFTWLDFVSYREPAASLPAVPATEPTEKVKCVVWDLDNTVWSGILAESEPDDLALRQGVVELVEALDQRGILQSVVSKNNHEDAWRVVERHGLADYFLHPAINWGQKSANVRQIAELLNIGLDTFALIDDSPFERAEVAESLPMVRVYDETVLDSLLSLPEFDVPVTEMSAKRRQSYMLESERRQAEARFAGDYNEFLRSCEMTARFFEPHADAEVKRCWELVQRSNQLNLSTRRYSEAEFAEVLGTDGILCVAIDCKDRFGEYGIVGFCSVDERPANPHVTDFVLSCRVAQKHVEHTLFDWLAERARERGADALEAEFISTPRNAVLRTGLDEIGFRPRTEGGERTLLALPVDDRPELEPVIEVVADVEALRA
jgi:FkbH-like protein